MTSLIFGSIYMGHKGIVNHRREKQRKKNYQRWEGLRDEYDEQRKISRESRSLDIQRTGTDFAAESDRPILTLRDQQEADDARTSWRPQESFTGVAPASQADRRASVEVTAGSGLRPLVPKKTGATWDEGLPQRLPVSRRVWDEYQPSSLGANVSRSGSLREKSAADSPARDRSVSNTPPSMNKQASPHAELPASSSSHHLVDHRSVSMPTQTNYEAPVEAYQHARPGGMMAELIESSNAGQQREQSPFPPPPQETPFSHPYQNPYTQPQHNPFSQPPPSAYGGFQPTSYASPLPSATPQAAGMQEWWN